MNGEYEYFAQHLHLHSCYEPGASMEGHIYHASQLGMKYIWFTDHDIRMGRKRKEFDRYNFDFALTEEDTSGDPRGFKPCDDNVGTAEYCCDGGSCGNGCMKLTVESDGDEWVGAGAILFSGGKSHCSSLLSDVSISFDYKMKVTDAENQRLIFDFRLSERPPYGDVAHILYVVGNSEGLYQPNRVVKTIAATNEWTTCLFNLSHDVTEEIGGIDNVFDTVTIRLEAKCAKSAEAYIGSFIKTVNLGRNETRENQKKVAAKIAEKYGVTPFVATEISLAGRHKNVFSTSIPIIDYEKINFEVSHTDACQYLIERGGVFSINHPFSAFKRKDLSLFDIDAEVIKIADSFLEQKCFGARLLEVGFPNGRYLPLRCHLKLWDLISLQGCFLTGYGCSDAHSINSGWYSGNNFATWLGVKKNDTATEEAFVESMRAGRAYTGNPVLLRGDVSFVSGRGAPMGSVCVLNCQTTESVCFSADKMQVGWTLKWIINGENSAQSIVCSERICETVNLTTSLPVNFARVELYDENGTLVLLTNPIYFVREDLNSIDVPRERVYLT